LQKEGGNWIPAFAGMAAESKGAEREVCRGDTSVGWVLGGTKNRGEGFER